MTMIPSTWNVRKGLPRKFNRKTKLLAIARKCTTLSDWRKFVVKVRGGDNGPTHRNIEELLWETLEVVFKKNAPIKLQKLYGGAKDILMFKNLSKVATLNSKWQYEIAPGLYLTRSFFNVITPERLNSPATIIQHPEIMRITWEWLTNNSLESAASLCCDNFKELNDIFQFTCCKKSH